MGSWDAHASKNLFANTLNLTIFSQPGSYLTPWVVGVPVVKYLVCQSSAHFHPEGLDLISLVSHVWFLVSSWQVLWGVLLTGGAGEGSGNEIEGGGHITYHRLSLCKAADNASYFRHMCDIMGIFGWYFLFIIFSSTFLLSTLFYFFSLFQQFPESPLLTTKLGSPPLCPGY